MIKFRFIILFVFILFFVACTPADEAVDVVRPTATAVSPDLGVSSPTASATEAIPTETAATEAPAADELATFIEQLQTAVTSQMWAEIPTFMSDPIAIGAWRSEWRMYTPADTMAAFQNASLPSPLSVQFTGLTDDELTTLIGQPPATIFGPEINVVAALHSTGWGQSISDEAILFVTEQDGRYTWSGFLYANGRFADANLGGVSAPVGLIYLIWSNGLYQIQPNGQHRQLLDAEQVSIPNLRISPDGRYAAYTNDQQQLWVISTATGNQQQFAADVTPSGYVQWGDKNTLFVGIWLDPSEGEGPNNGHIATLNISTGDLTILDETRLSSGRPSYLSDYTWSALDVFPSSQDDILTGRTYHPDSGLQIFDQTTFEGNSGNPIFNPAWSPDPTKIAWLTYGDEGHMLQLFDTEVKTAVTLLTWDPARFGALVPSPVWSPDGRWLALEVWTNGPEGSGIWLLAADGSSQTLIDADGRDPYWVNGFQLIYGVNSNPRLYDIQSGEAFVIADLPTGSWVLGVTSEADLQAMPVDAEDAPQDLYYPDPTTLAVVSEVIIDSPDGRWQATATQTEPVIVGDLEKLYVTLSVTDGTTTWEPIAEWRGYGLGYIWPVAYQWSADGRSLYYMNTSTTDGCLYYMSGIDLYQLDITTGESVEILPDGKTINLSLSPDQSILAYTTFQDETMFFVTKELATGTEQSVAIAEKGEMAQTGHIFWSADGETAVFALIHNACNPAESSSIIRLNIPDMTATTLISQDVRRFFVNQWPEPEQSEIQLSDKDGNIWWLEINSGELAQEQ